MTPDAPPAPAEPEPSPDDRIERLAREEITRYLTTDVQRRQDDHDQALTDADPGAAALTGPLLDRARDALQAWQENGCLTPEHARLALLAARAQLIDLRYGVQRRN
ncbi:hypothetical protein, partial [Longimycelium tulufanense]|uniref:hypothetical protein n=1 Tax=Longimycelium tulufanense TaxID=907463 RepID=UPI001E3DE396